MTHEQSKPQLLFELARGGMGSIYLARTAGIGDFERFVIVKRVLDRGNTDPSSIDRFLNEAKVAARIHHANVVGTHHVGVDEQGPYMVLEYIEGGSLAELVQRAALRGSTIPVPLVLRIALDALAGLAAVHALGTVHRDISLQNVLVGRDGIARVADFGIAKSTGSSVKTKSGAIIGKLLYLPPEHICNQPVDARADLYMLGVTLWCALTSEEPWQAKHDAQLLHQIITEPMPTLASRLREPVAPQIEALVSKACKSRVHERFQSAQEMRLAIEQLGRERGWVASQHEVAQFVEGLLGVDLDRRHARVVDILRTKTGAVEGDAATVVADVPAHEATAGSAVVPISRPEHRNSRILWTALAVTVVASVTGFWIWRTMMSVQPNASVAPLESPRAVVAPHHGAAALPAPLPAPLAAPVAAPLAGPAPSSANRPAAPIARDVRGANLKPAISPPVAPASSPNSAERRNDSASTPSPPDEISTRNPYRSAH